jgi:hypothetical protein
MVFIHIEHIFCICPFLVAFFSATIDGRTDRRTEVKQYTPSPFGERGYNHIGNRIKQNIYLKYRIIIILIFSVDKATFWRRRLPRIMCRCFPISRREQVTFHEMTMLSALYQTNTLTSDFYSTNSLKQSVCRYGAPVGHIILVQSQSVFALSS